MTECDALRERKAAHAVKKTKDNLNIYLLDSSQYIYIYICLYLYLNLLVRVKLIDVSNT